MPSKTIKEIVTDISGNTTIEFSDDSLQKFNVKDTATYSTDSNGNVVGLVGPDGRVYSISRGVSILNGAVAGSDSGWVPISNAPERFVYQLNSGSTSTAFSVDISADGSTSIGQAFTGTWTSSASAEITFPVMYSNPLAKYFRWNVLSGGPLSVSRGV